MQKSSNTSKLILIGVFVVALVVAVIVATSGGEDSPEPFDPNSIFKVTDITRPNTTEVDVTWSTVAGKRYELLTSASPGGPFTAVGTIVTANGSTSTQRVASSAPAFYRVRIVP